MTIRTLESPPNLLTAYARAAGSLVPLAGRLPFIPGHGEGVPDLTLQLLGVQPDAEHLRRYCEACAFARRRETLPATYPHILAFPLHMALMTDGRFPFGAIGLVHVENRITQCEPIPVDATLSFTVHATPVEPHRRGRAFTIVTEARVDGRRAWEERSTMLRRQGEELRIAGNGRPRRDPPAGSLDWELPGDLGRRYAAVSGDRNPIHMNRYAARALGFPRAIAHGMWMKARCLAALEGGEGLPAGFDAAVRFRKPLLLPGTASFGSRRAGGAVAFALRGAQSPGDVHLEGEVRPAPPQPNERTRGAAR